MHTNPHTYTTTGIPVASGRTAPVARVALAILPLLLAACGGGGGGGGGGTGGTSNPPPPTDTTYSVGGSVSGLSGTGLVLQNNGGDDLAVSANGGFTFATEVGSGERYEVTVLSQPVSPAQTCTVNGGSGVASADVSSVSVVCATDNASTDTDGDGLTDVEEVNDYGTSPVLPDTDGDGYSDFDELITNGFDPAVNNFVFNPRVADVPVLLIRVQETPVIGWNYVEGTAQGTTTSTSRSQSQTNATATTFGASTTVGVEATTSATVGGGIGGPSAEVSQSVSVSASATVSFDRTNTQENQTAWEEMQSNNVETTRDTRSGFMRFGVRIENGGHLAFRLENLSLSSTRTSEGADPFIPTGTLNLDGSQSFPATSIGPSDSTPLLTFEQNDMDLGTVRSLLTNVRSLQVEPLYEIVDRDGVPFPFREQDVANNTAKVLIDYGPYREAEFYQVATNTTPNSPGQTLDALLADILMVPANSDANGVNSVRSVESTSGRWVVTRNRQRDTDLETTIFDTVQSPYSLDSIDVRARDEILLVLLEDADGDNIGYREERLHGTDPGNPDTDSDGVSDFDEIRESWTVTAISQVDADRYPATVFSSPIAADYDGDSLNDDEERSHGLDPYNSDTDGDGVADNVDSDNGNLPLVNSSRLYLGDDPLVSGQTEYLVSLIGSLGARPPNVVANADIDWMSDGSNVTSFQTVSGGNSSVDIDSSFDYPGPGQYQITLTAQDDQSPANSLTESATVVLTEATRPEDVYGYQHKWYTERNVREVVDIDMDGHADIVGISNSGVHVSLGSTSGFAPRQSWSAGHWHYGIYDSVRDEPRRFADIDNNNHLDIIGVDVTAQGAVVRYGLNNGGGFDDPVDWVQVPRWTTATDTFHMADVDNNGFLDFVHARADADGIQAYTVNGASLQVTSRPMVQLPDTEIVDRRSYPIELTDLDGDRCADIVYFGSGATWFARSMCNGQFAPFDVLVEGFGYNDDAGWRVDLHKRWVDDVTNDGLPDLVAAGTDNVFVVVNRSTAGAVAFGSVQAFGDDFVSSEGWADNKVVGSTHRLDIHPRYLADVNDDGYKDIVGYAGHGAAVGINRLGVDGAARFVPVRIVATDFDIDATDANGDTRWWEDDAVSCAMASPCRGYFPRKVGDVDGDGRADLIGFDRDGIVLQFMPYVTQFQ